VVLHNRSSYFKFLNSSFCAVLLSCVPVPCLVLAVRTPFSELKERHWRLSTFPAQTGFAVVALLVP